MNRYKNMATAILATGIMALSLSACNKEGPAEKAGKEMDKTMDKAGQQIEKAGEKIENAAKDAQK
ncbi:hypothetical protein DBR37_02455 [Herminiimonas sp. KBW02]|uniref:hypothetical protein n=1 Tax=Herminiimonas sp. KBW02 TaxID=2153363 RepID=UPI000F5B7B28|nr:hypothetical protein [Herminiimonas sp. KBW02]RQO37076.1 hypothetical protein DBR37_02455 [Herminiimonas sp. KBW02]